MRYFALLISASMHFCATAQVPSYYKQQKSFNESLKNIVHEVGLDSTWDVGDDGKEQISFAVIDLTGKKPLLGGVNFTNFIYPASVYKMYVAMEILKQVSYWNAPNPKPGSVFTYYLKEDIKTLREKRQEAEKQRIKIGDPPFYPSIDSLRMEDIQPAPYLLFTVTDENGNAVRRLKASAKKGINRISWDFRTDPTSPINFVPFDESNVFGSGPRGIMVLPGTYKVSLSKFEDGVYTQLVAPQSFKIEALNMVGMSDADKKALHDCGKKASELKRAVDGTNAYRTDLLNRLRYMKEAALQTAAIDQSIVKDIISLEKRLGDVSTKLNGDETLARREFETPPSISNRIANIMDGVISTTVAPTNTAINSYNVCAQQFAPLLAEVKAVGEEVKRIENLLEKSGAPYTPGRIPDWKL